MQTVHEHEAFAVAPDKDWGRLADLQHTLRNLSHSVGLKRRTALYGHIDVCDRNIFAFQHGPGDVERNPTSVIISGIRTSRY
jgi:hypothetical protein